MKRRPWFALLFAIGMLTTAVAGGGQELVPELAIFEGLVDTSWTGRFTSTPAPPFDHAIEWSVILDGHVVQWSKRVDAVDFSMETFFYWDADLEAVAFTQLVSNGIHGKGYVESIEGGIALVGLAMQMTGIVDFKQTFVLTEEGTLEDRYYTRSGDDWVPEHVIVYRLSREDSDE